MPSFIEIVASPEQRAYATGYLKGRLSMHDEVERLTAALQRIADGDISGSFGPNAVFAKQILEGKSLEEAYTKGVTLTRGF